MASVKTYLMVKRAFAPLPSLAFVPRFVLRCLRIFRTLTRTKVYQNVVLGGTFDRLHYGHCLLLTEALLRAKNRITIGVTDGKMLESKTLPEFILPCDTRIENLKNYLNDCDPSLEYNIVPIYDPFGPSIIEEDLTAIVGSAETSKGCDKVNEKRLDKGLNELDIILIDLEPETQKQSSVEEDKVSSSSIRIRMLGDQLKPPLRCWDSTSKAPYIVGLTGGSASGKSSVAKKLQHLGAGIVDCDRLGHRAYEPGTKCFEKVTNAFGEEIKASDGSINRGALGKIVFSSPDNKSKLESIVWPEIRRMASEEAKNLFDNGHNVVVLDAAVLLSANWHRQMCHQVWSCIIKHDEAVKRIMKRDGKSEDEAKLRLKSQMSNADVVKESNVVFCTQWEEDFTRRQVEKAWKHLCEYHLN